METQGWVSIGSSNGLLPDGTKPLPDPMLTYHQRVQWPSTEGKSIIQSIAYRVSTWQFAKSRLPTTAFFTQDQFWTSGIVVVCVCACVNHEFVRAITHHQNHQIWTKDEKKKLFKIPIVFGVEWPWHSRSNLSKKSKFHAQFVSILSAESLRQRLNNTL